MPNNDLISREKLQKAFERECIGECGCCKHIKHNPEGCALIDNAPTVDAEPARHGKWEIINRNEARCSECKMIRNIGNQTGWNFCPNCGAKMDKED